MSEMPISLQTSEMGAAGCKELVVEVLMLVKALILPV